MGVNWTQRMLDARSNEMHIRCRMWVCRMGERWVVQARQQGQVIDVMLVDPEEIRQSNAKLDDKTKCALSALAEGSMVEQYSMALCKFPMPDLRPDWYFVHTADIKICVACKRVLLGWAEHDESLREQVGLML